MKSIALTVVLFDVPAIFDETIDMASGMFAAAIEPRYMPPSFALCCGTAYIRTRLKRLTKFR